MPHKHQFRIQVHRLPLQLRVSDKLLQPFQRHRPPGPSNVSAGDPNASTCISGTR
jgi:hypothetical protein